MNPRAKPAPQQRGAATLFITFSLLLISSMAMLYAARHTLSGTAQVSAQIQSRLAFAAAQAGLERATAHAADRRSGGINRPETPGDPPSRNIPALEPTALARDMPCEVGEACQAAAFCAADFPIPTCPPTPTALHCTPPLIDDYLAVTAARIWACGWSPDHSQRHGMTQHISLRPSLPGARLAMPVVARDAYSLIASGADILNFFSDLTVWSGTSFNPYQLPTAGQTFIRDLATHPLSVVDNPYTPDDESGGHGIDFRAVGNAPGCTPGTTPDGYRCSAPGGHDLILGDTSLTRHPSPEALFQFLFNRSLTDYRLAATHLQHQDHITTEDDIDALRGAATFVATSTLTLPSSGHIGTPAQPAILVTPGDLRLGRHGEFNGLLFVGGELELDGPFTLYGALVLGGSTYGNGRLTLVYDPYTLAAAARIGPLTLDTGSWKDWRDTAP